MRPLLTALVVVFTLAGCGGGDALDAEVPSSYVTFRGEGVAFAHPPGWRPEPQPFVEGATQIFFEPGAASMPTPFPRISLVVEGNVTPEEFERTNDQVRELQVDRPGEILSDEEVDVEGAQIAFVSVVELAPGPGTDPVTVRSTALDLLTDDGTSVALSVAVPQREGEELVDAEAVLSSFRLLE